MTKVAPAPGSTSKQCTAAGGTINRCTAEVELRRLRQLQAALTCVSKAACNLDQLCQARRYGCSGLGQQGWSSLQAVQQQQLYLPGVLQAVHERHKLGRRCRGKSPMHLEPAAVIVFFSCHCVLSVVIVFFQLSLCFVSMILQPQRSSW
jgi:hypothetical protein